MRKVHCLIVLNLFLVFLVQGVYADQVWSVREGVFTVGRPSLFRIYVQNTGAETDTYTITYDVEYVHQPEGDLSHLIQVHLVSDKIENLGSNQVRDTQGTITLLAEVFDPGATITFSVDSDGGGHEETTLQITGVMPQVLPEFSLVGFLQLLLLGLVVFYSFHVR